MALTRNPDAIRGNQWPSTHLCSANGIGWQLVAISGTQWHSVAISGPPRTCARLTASSPSYQCRPRPPASAPYRAHVGQGIRSRYNLGTVIRGNQAPYSSSPHGQSVAISGNQWQSVAVKDNQGQSGAISVNQRQSVSIRGNQCQSDAIKGNQRLSEAIRGNQGQSGAIRGNQGQSEPHHTCAPSTLTHVRSRSTRSAAWRVRGRRLSGKLSKSSVVK